ncbi:MAG: hypothetical protein HYV28_02325 [Ignavibacteriales bacterium]|nr:hypothetical protein [Ignavibacteriales bacterium]
MTEHDFDLSNYRLPQDRGQTSRITRLHPALPRNTDNVPFDIFDYEMLFKDEGVLQMMRSGNTIGCFYIESPGMRSLLKRLSVDTFEMLTAASSVIRPGVAESGMMQEFIARHHDPKRRKYLLPEMEKILGETYGVMIYQEDVIKIAHHIAGLTLDEADLLRRAMSGKMRSHDAMTGLKLRFFQSATDRGLTVQVTDELWRQIESFAGYAFCKAHSASFALLSFQVAFLKVYYPAEFMAGVLSNGGGYYSAAVYIQECRRQGLTVLLPCINKSSYDYTGLGASVRIGLMAIKNLPKASAEAFLDERKKHGPFLSLEDFIIRTRAGFEDTTKLIKCGAMDCFGKTRPTLLRLLDLYYRTRRLFDPGYNDLFAGETQQLERDVETTEEYSTVEKCLIEMETFDYMVTRHPLQFFNKWTHDPGILKALSDTFEAVLFPKAYGRFAAETLCMGPFLVEGIVDIANGNNLVVDKMQVLAAIELKSALQKDSVENNYFGDVEKVAEEDFTLAAKLGQKKLVHAYAG